MCTIFSRSVQLLNVSSFINLQLLLLYYNIIPKIIYKCTKKFFLNMSLCEYIRPNIFRNN